MDYNNISKNTENDQRDKIWIQKSNEMVSSFVINKLEIIPRQEVITPLISLNLIVVKVYGK